MISKNDLYNYSWKKKELIDGLAACTNSTLREKYEKAIRVTDEAFDLYGEFYKTMGSLIERLLTTYGERENQLNIIIAGWADAYKSQLELAQQIGEREEDGIDSILDAFIHHKQSLSESIRSAEKLGEIFLHHKESTQELVEVQSKLIRVILESTVETLFLYVYRLDMTDDLKVVKDFVRFCAGMVPILGRFASGFNTIVNIIRARAMKLRAADSVLNYLDNYYNITTIWILVTRGYVEMLNEWRQGV